MLKVGGIYTTSNYIDIIVKITDDKIYSYYINDVFTFTNEIVEKKLKTFLRHDISHFSYVNKKLNINQYSGYLGQISDESLELLLNKLNKLQKEKEF